MEKYGVVFATTAANKDPRLYLKVTGDKCPFFLDGTGCSIHNIKPLICRLFPGMKPGQTAKDVKDFVNKHAISEGIKKCVIFTMPDDALIGVEPDVIVKTAIFDSIETIYYKNLDHKDMNFVLRLLKLADRDDLRNVVYDYIFNGSKESGLVFEQTMFEIQALCQINDWGKVPVFVAHEGVTPGNREIYLHISSKLASDILAMSNNDEIESAFCQANPSIADPDVIFISVALKTRSENGLMMAFPILRKDLLKVAPDGVFKLAFYASDGSMDNVAALPVRIDLKPL
jgi:hypothetical protein